MNDQDQVFEYEPSEKKMLLTLRFDGSFRGGCGGAGAVLLHSPSETVQWQGARFLSECPSSAAAEYEGLILGLEAAVQMDPGELHVEGDCRLVLSQAAGSARPRKMGKLHKRASDLLERLAPELIQRPKFSSIPRDTNAHADALSRVAVNGMQRLHRSAILGTARGGDVHKALAILDHASRDHVRLPSEVFDELMERCEAAGEWRTLLSVYAAAHRDPTRRTARTYEHAIGALGALGASSRGSDPSSKQLAELMRQRAAVLRRSELQRLHSPQGPDAIQTKDTNGAPDAIERGAAADRWLVTLEREAGGQEVLNGEVPDEVPRLLSLAERLAAPYGLALRGEDAFCFEG